MAVGRPPSGGTHRCWSITLGLVVVQELLGAIPAQEAILRRDRGWAANHASGNNSASRSIGWVGSRSSTSLRYAKGSPRAACNCRQSYTAPPPSGRPGHSRQRGSSSDRGPEPVASARSGCCRCSARRRGCTSGDPPTGPGCRRWPYRAGSWGAHDWIARPATPRTLPQIRHRAVRQGSLDRLLSPDGLAERSPWM